MIPPHAQPKQKQTQQQISSAQKQRQRRAFPTWIRWIIGSFLGVIILLGTVLWIIQGTQAVVPIAIFTALGTIFAYLQIHSIIFPGSKPTSPEKVNGSSHQTSQQPPLGSPLSASSSLSALPSPRTSASSGSAQVPPPPIGTPGEPANTAWGATGLSIDWGEAPDIGQFYGRDRELDDLKHWAIDDHCRVVAILGMGGIGKTRLAATFVDWAKDRFSVVFWRSLQNAPPLKNILQDCIQFLSYQQQTLLPSYEDAQIALLLEYLRNAPCLVVLDNIESILQSGTRAGQYIPGYQGYAKLFRRLGEARHQSCLLLTGREKPREIGLLEGSSSSVRSLHLEGVRANDGRKILHDKGLHESVAICDTLINRYTGNPLALMLVAQFIQDAFHSNIAEFLQEEAVIFNDIRDILNQQFERLSATEQYIMYWLAIEREKVWLETLFEDSAHSVSKLELSEALSSLRQRSLVEAGTTGFTLQNVIMEYMTDSIVNQIVTELSSEHLDLFESHALLKAQTKDYLRESQMQLILRPIGLRLIRMVGKERINEKLKSLLTKLRETQPLLYSYAAGNLLNLLIEMGSDIHGYDFSQLEVRQAYLRNITLPDVSFAHAQLIDCAFIDTFGGVLAVALSPQGDLVAAGTANGEVRIWYTASGMSFRAHQSHIDWVRSVIFSPDGKILASGAEDHLVHLWEVQGGQLLKTLQGHTDRIWSVAFSPDGTTLASGGDDQAVRLWAVSSGQVPRTLQSHSDRVRSVAFSPDGKTLASGAEDHLVHLWEVQGGQLLKTLQGHTDRIWSVAFSPDGTTLASGGDDQTVRLWAVSSGQVLQTLQGHSDRVRSVAFSPDGKTLASGSDDQTLRLWEGNSGQCLKAFRGHSDRVCSVTFSPDGATLVSGSDDQTVRFWEVSSGQCVRSFQGYTNPIRSIALNLVGTTLVSGGDDQKMRLWEVSSGRLLGRLPGNTSRIWAVTFNPQGTLVARGGEDQAVQFWEVNSGQLLRTLQGHTARVRSVAFSPDGLLFVSGAEDQTVRIWEVSSGQCLKTLQGDIGWIYSAVFSPDGNLLACGSEDQTVRIWEVSSGQCLKTLQGHTNPVRSVAFSPDRKILASSSDDQTVRLWEVETGQCLTILRGHTNRVRSVAFSLDGTMLVSGGEDQTVRLWEVRSGLRLHTFQGHTGWVWSVAFHPDNQHIFSGSHDGTIKRWHIQTGECLQTLISERPYERMDITGTQGLTVTQRTTLAKLGAIELNPNPLFPLSS